MDNKKLFAGSGGSGPSSTPDSLLSEDMVEFALAVSEGPIRGLTNGAYSFYIGDTPLVSESGGRNFEKFAIGVHPGYPEGSAQPLNLKLGGISSNFAVGVVLLKNTGVIRQTQSQLRNRINEIEVRLQFSRLMRADDDGSTAQNTASFKIEYRPASSQTWQSVTDIPPVIKDPIRFKETPEWNPDWAPSTQPPAGEVRVRGKTTSGYVKEVRFEVPLINDDWVIRVTKLSPDNDPKDIVDVSWESYQATSRTNMTFPDTAIVHGIGVANGQFSSLPDLGGVYDGLVIRVPSNYNPDTRTYDETTPWNGSFKFAWTNNPAWILYDMIMNQRYGLAKHRRYLDANRFSFYQAAKWCDTPVTIPGSTETRPRYTFNMQISEARPGLEMLNYVAGSFNGLVWDDLQGQLHLRVDKDDPAAMLFSPENVSEDGFQYTFTDLSSRANDISVAFINPDLDWNEDRRRIPNVTTNEEHIEKYGRIPLDFIAVGCTNVHEAISKAQVRLISALTETATVTFQTARQGAVLELYDVILIADPTMGWSQSGRITTYDTEWLNFRDPIYIETMEPHVVRIQSVDGIVEVPVMPEHIGHVTRLRLQETLPEFLPRYTVFTLEGQNGGIGYAKPFRVMALAEAEGNPYMYDVTAVEINRNKYTQVEGETTDLSEFDYSTKIPYLPGEPTNFAAASGEEQIIIMPTGEVVARIQATWRKPFNTMVKGYILQYRLLRDGDTAWETIETTTTSAFISPAIVGERYGLRLAAIDLNNKRSGWVYIEDHLVKGKTAKPQKIATLSAVGEVFQIKLAWNFGANPSKNLKKVEVWAGTTVVGEASKMTDLAYPTNQWTHLGLGVNVTIKYWIRVQDSFGNYSDWTGPATATTVKDPSKILDQLEDSINEDHLIDDLKDRIDLIDAPDTIVGSVANRILDASKAVDAAFLVERTAWTTSTEAVATELGIVASKFETEVGKAMAAVAKEATARTTAFEAEALTRQEQLAEFKTNAETFAQSYVQTYAYSKATADESYNQLYQVLTSEYKGYSDSAYANVTSNFYTKTDVDSAIAGKIEQVTARLDSVGGITIEEAMTATADSINGLKAQYSVKIDSGGRVVGFGLSSTEPITGDPQSTFAIVADKFAIAYPGMDDNYPFMVGMVNGQSVVGINGAVVIDGTLTVKEADIENASISTLKLAGEAVTIPIVSNIPEVKEKGRGRGEGIWTSVNEAYIKFDQPGLLYVLHTASLGFEANERYWSFIIKVNGGDVRSIMGRQPESAPVLSASVPLPAGVHKVEIFYSSHRQVYIGYSEIFMMGVKK